MPDALPAPVMTATGRPSELVGFDVMLALESLVASWRV